MASDWISENFLVKRNTIVIGSLVNTIKTLSSYGLVTFTIFTLVIKML